VLSFWLAILSSLKIDSTFNLCIKADVRIATPHTRKSLFPDNASNSNSISKSFTMSIFHTSCLSMREGLNNRFKGGWENLFFVIESFGSSTVKAVYIK
jgi:hypothetical protein